MSMVFTTSYSGVPILFESWAPKDNGAFVGAWFAIFFWAILFRALIWMRSVFETRWAARWYRKYEMRPVQSRTDSDSINAIDKLEEKRSALSSSQRQLQTHAPFRLQVEVPRMLLVFVTVILGYSLMLITMTYVVGYFFAVCTGLAVGELIFGRYSHKYNTALPKDETLCCV
ncbi:putative Ctr copper transporter [Taphrina deformans PYCC 5710]|uniref:Copper transport protein n=1 Tax=Taphrina deformans (strain PYCC 5710 / ATCC 11124 / CBS 356.35 / IMI 108563 / JCM 9778 / NBRC 8474) TaxID=1097556 RepID=R4XGJ7_TAPDE|nr:putative Ctr copper transporter [Taphrina deformans PYCC 5710]|eukprot:CCG83622.1 putative Ctr copper transporter [Taphrina deformans PYCC 5710]